MIAHDPARADHPLMTLRHAAGRTGLSATTLRRYIKAGRLKARLHPGRYGPEYVVDDEDLRTADLPSSATAVSALDAPGDAAPTVTPASSPARSAAPANDTVPGLLYRELLMKHEHLLVQFGMLRVSGQQLYEVRREAESRATQAREALADLAAIRDRHAREIGALKARVRQAELEIAARDDQIAAARAEARRLEIALRNTLTASQIDEQFARGVLRAPGAPTATAPEPVHDH